MLTRYLHVRAILEKTGEGCPRRTKPAPSTTAKGCRIDGLKEATKPLPLFDSPFVSNSEEVTKPKSMRPKSYRPDDACNTQGKCMQLIDLGTG